MLKKKKQKINTKKNKFSKKRIKKSVRKSSENIFGQQIEIQQKVAPVIEIRQGASEVKTQTEVIKNILTEPDKKEYKESIEIARKTEYNKNVNQQNDFSQRQKLVLMYIAIGTIMCFIVCFWLFSVKNTLSQGLKGQSQNEDLSGIVNEIGNGVHNLSNIIQNQKDELNNFSDRAKSLIIEEQIKSDVANKIKEQLQGSNSNLNLNTNQ